MEVMQNGENSTHRSALRGKLVSECIPGSRLWQTAPHPLLAQFPQQLNLIFVLCILFSCY